MEMKMSIVVILKRSKNEDVKFGFDLSSLDLFEGHFSISWLRAIQR